jgi:glycosyltransferase involved in cell wall biosynthesis
MNPSVLPFVSVLTPTCNRRVFIPQLIRNFCRQSYPIDRMELVVMDDGEDPVADLMPRMLNVRYIALPERIPLGRKRNLLSAAARGDIIVHMDDDDYYPPTRVSHAVNRLLGSDRLIAGSRIVLVYNLQNDRVVCSGPFGTFQAGSGSFAYRREYLEQNRWADEDRHSIEPAFTAGFTRPMVELNPLETIVVIQHNLNTWDKRRTATVPTRHTLRQLIRDEEALRFYRFQLRAKLGLSAGARRGAPKA